jgi:hypothetical protein
MTTTSTPGTGTPPPQPVQPAPPPTAPSSEGKTVEEQEQEALEEEERAQEAQREWDALDPEERSKRAVEQNKEIQRRVRDQINQEEETRLQALRESVGKEAVTSTRGMTFKEAAEATEKLNQPPNFSAARERERETGSQPDYERATRRTTKSTDASPRPATKSGAGSTPPSTP